MTTTHRTRWLGGLAALLALAGCAARGSSPAGAPPPRADICAAPDALSAMLLGYLRYVVTATVTTDAQAVAERERDDLPAMAPERVRKVMDPAVCAQAAAAYTAVLHDTTIAAQQRRMHVIAAGRRYWVVDANLDCGWPEEAGCRTQPGRAGEWLTVALFDDRWRLVRLEGL